MTGFLKKVFWMAALAGVGYLGYQHAPGQHLVDLVGVPSTGASEASARTLSETSARTLSVNCVDVNDANYQALQRIKYVNPIRAKTILEVRMDRPFRTLDDLTLVKGINSYRVEEIRRQGVACVR